MSKSSLFIEASLPDLHAQSSLVDGEHGRLLLGYAVGKSIVRAVIPALRRDEQGELPARTQVILDDMQQFGAPELCRDAVTRTIGLNLTAIVVTISALRQLQNQMHAGGQETEEYMRVVNDTTVLSDGARELHLSMTGVAIPHAIESLEG